MKAATAPGIEPECHPCVMRQALRTAQAAGLDIRGQQAVLDTALRGLLKHGVPPWTTLGIGRSVADKATRLAGKWIDHDVYGPAKTRANAVAISFEERLRRSIREAADPLAMAIRVSAAGNIIDFGAKDHATLDLEGECEAIGTQPFGRFDLEEFRQRLADARDILFVCDNAGEIVFDVLLMETLHELRPGLRIHAALRERPILNDATITDARAIGMHKVARLLSSGSVYAGTPLEECSDEFRQLFSGADLVVSKGQGNFSSLRAHAHDRMFFALRIKCSTIARISGLVLDELQFVQSTNL